MKISISTSIAFALLTLFFACKQRTSDTNAGAFASQLTDTMNDKKQIASMLDSFNSAAAAADYDKYFSYYTADATFTGTDATEHWDKNAFMVWAKPYFDKKTTWDFKPMVRNIYFAKSKNIAWFDELLNTRMKICRGSGVLIKENNEWKVQQYVLSTTIPNSKLDSVIRIKAAVEDSLIDKLSGQ